MGLDPVSEYTRKTIPRMSSSWTYFINLLLRFILIHQNLPPSAPKKYLGERSPAWSTRNCRRRFDDLFTSKFRQEWMKRQPASWDKETNSIVTYSICKPENRQGIMNANIRNRSKEVLPELRYSTPIHCPSHRKRKSFWVGCFSEIRKITPRTESRRLVMPLGCNASGIHLAFNNFDSRTKWSDVFREWRANFSNS